MFSDSLLCEEPSEKPRSYERTPVDTELRYMVGELDLHRGRLKSLEKKMEDGLDRDRKLERVEETLENQEFSYGRQHVSRVFDRVMVDGDYGRQEDIFV